MTFSRLALAACLAVVFVVALVVSAPARLLSLVVPGNTVSLQGLSGTVWEGSASRSMVKLPAGHFHLGRLDWSLDPLSLLLFRPRLTVQSEWGPQTASGEVSLRGMRSVDVKDFEANFAASLAKQFAPLAVDGSISVQVSDLAVRDGLPAGGQGRVVWQDAAWLSPQGPVLLGSYAMDFQQDDEQPVLGRVITLAGPMRAEGEASLDQRRYNINVLITSDEVIDGPIQHALSLMAAPEGDGYRLALEGDI
ncbi:MAG: type II secretion system protein N [Halioglobus sp.]